MLDERYGEKPPALHPLGGANWRTLRQALRGHAPFDARSRSLRFGCSAATLARFPFYHLERFRSRSAIEAQSLDPPPIFIVGHWRSGTTHLHNVLSRDPQFGWMSFLQTSMPWDFLGKLKIAPPLIEKVLPETRGMDNVKLSLDSPQEEEMALGNMGPIGYYYAYYFPRSMRTHVARACLLEGLSAEEREGFAVNYRYLLKKLAVACEGKRLLLKNPPNTGRLRWLSETFPGAKFIHIVRNPYEVYCSTLRHWGRTLAAFSWQDFRDFDPIEATLENYRLLMQRYLADRDTLGDALHEVRFEDLERDPVGVAKGIYGFLGLDSKNGLDAIGAYAEAEKDYRKNTHKLPADQARRVKDEWAFALNAWGYERPEGIEVVENGELSP